MVRVVVAVVLLLFAAAAVVLYVFEKHEYSHLYTVACSGDTDVTIRKMISVFGKAREGDLVQIQERGIVILLIDPYDEGIIKQKGLDVFVVNNETLTCSFVCRECRDSIYIYD